MERIEEKQNTRLAPLSHSPRRVATEWRAWDVLQNKTRRVKLSGVQCEGDNEIVACIGDFSVDPETTGMTVPIMRLPLLRGARLRLALGRNREHETLQLR